MQQIKHFSTIISRQGQILGWWLDDIRGLGGDGRTISLQLPRHAGYAPSRYADSTATVSLDQFRFKIERIRVVGPAWREFPFHEPPPGPKELTNYLIPIDNLPEYFWDNRPACKANWS